MYKCHVCSSVQFVFERKMIMRLFVRFITVVSLAALLSIVGVFAQERTSLEIRGDVQKPRVWSVDDVKKGFAGEIQTVKSSRQDKEKKTVDFTVTGIPLTSLLKAAELKTEKTPKHYDLTFIVIFEAHDGYRVFFTLAELLLNAKENPTLLVWEENGKPLPGEEPPFRLFTKGSDRSIWGITRITLVDGHKLAVSLK